MTYGEMLTYLGILFAMTLHKLTNKSLYWKTLSYGLVTLPNYAQVIGSKQFEGLFAFRILWPHVQRMILSTKSGLQDICRALMRFPGEYVSMDEGRIRFSCKTVQPNKPIKVGITMYIRNKVLA
jgi:hypothetical protein